MKTQENIPVAIQVQTKVNQADEEKEYFFDVQGHLVQIGSTLYIRYQEPMVPNTSTVSVTLKIEPEGTIQLIRSGEVRTRLKFTYREYNETNYKTPHGSFPIQTYAKNLRISLKDQPLSGKIIIDYDLLTFNKKVGDYQLKIQFTA